MYIARRNFIYREIRADKGKEVTGDVQKIAHLETIGFVERCEEVGQKEEKKPRAKKQK